MSKSTSSFLLINFVEEVVVTASTTPLTVDQTSKALDVVDRARRWMHVANTRWPKVFG